MVMNVINIICQGLTLKCPGVNFVDPLGLCHDPDPTKPIKDKILDTIKDAFKDIIRNKLPGAPKIPKGFGPIGTITGGMDALGDGMPPFTNRKKDLEDFYNGKPFDGEY